MDLVRLFWKHLSTRRALLILACITALGAVVLYFAKPHDNLWEKTQLDLQARGEVLDWEQFIPKPVPRSDNLFGDSVAASLLSLKGSPAPSNPLGVGSPQFPANTDHLGRPFELARLKELPLDDVPEGGTNNLRGLATWFAQWDESFAQLRSAGKRPHARIPGNYSSPFDAPMLNFVAIRTTTHVLASRARLHLLLGDSAAALKDLDSLSVLMRALDAQPSNLVSAMIHVAVAEIYIDVVQDGLSEKLWADAELNELISRLSSINLLEVVRDGLRTERAAVLRHLNALANGPRDPIYATWKRQFSLRRSDGTFSLYGVFVRTAPGSWIRKNQAHYARLIQEHVESIDPIQRRVNLEKTEAANTELAELTARWLPHTALLTLVAPTFAQAAARMVLQQTRAHQAALAGAIEKFHREKGSCPERLDQLLPGCISALPQDLFTGGPISYQKTAHDWKLSAQAPNPADWDQTLQLVWTFEY